MNDQRHPKSSKSYKRWEDNDSLHRSGRERLPNTEEPFNADKKLKILKRQSQKFREIEEKVLD